MTTPLRDEKRERFVQLLIAGKSQREAYREAFNSKAKDASLDANASRLLKEDKVRIRYESLLKEVPYESDEELTQRMAPAVDDAVTMRRKIIQKLSEIAFVDEYSIGENGEKKYRNRNAQLQAANMLREMYHIDEAQNNGAIVIRLEGPMEEYSE